MEVALKTVNSPEKFPKSPPIEDMVVISPAKGLPKGSLVNPPDKQQQQHQHQQHQQKTKRKHRRGKPKAKNSNKPYKKTNWRFQLPRINYSKCGSAGGNGGYNRREKLRRSRSLAPNNTNKFIMEQHLSEIPCPLLTSIGRTRDSSFSMDSEDNYFFSLPEDEEEFLTKEFANVYEKARVERLEGLSKDELIEECLQIEDRYSKDQGNQRQQQLRIAQEYMSKIRLLDEKVKELSRENHNLRCQLMRSSTFAAVAAASPPSAAAPMDAACQPTPMDSSSEDSESDSSTTSSSSSSSSSSNNEHQQQQRRRRSCSSHSSLSEYNGYIKNSFMHNNLTEERQSNNQDQINQRQQLQEEDYERRQLLADHMDDEDDDDGIDGFHIKQQQQQQKEMLSSVNRSIIDENNADIQQNIVRNDTVDSNNIVEVVEHLKNPSN